jgi:hypothetical protein
MPGHPLRQIIPIKVAALRLDVQVAAAEAHVAGVDVSDLIGESSELVSG